MCLPLASFFWRTSRFLCRRTPNSSRSSRSHRRLHSNDARPCLPAISLWWFENLSQLFTCRLATSSVTLILIHLILGWWCGHSSRWPSYYTSHGWMVKDLMNLLCHVCELYPWISCAVGDVSRISCIYVLVYLFCDWEIRIRYWGDSTKISRRDKG